MTATEMTKEPDGRANNGRSENSKINLRAKQVTTLTEEVTQAFCTLLSQGQRMTTAAALVGVSIHTVHSWLKKGRAGDEPFDSFVYEVEKAVAYAEADLLKKVTDAAKRGDVKAAQWVLERRFSDGWGRRDVIEHTGDKQEVVIQLTWPHAERQAAARAIEAEHIEDAEVVEDVG